MNSDLFGAAVRAFGHGHRRLERNCRSRPRRRSRSSPPPLFWGGVRGGAESPSHSTSLDSSNPPLTPPCKGGGLCSRLRRFATVAVGANDRRLEGHSRAVRGSPTPHLLDRRSPRMAKRLSRAGRPTVGGFGEVGRPSPSAAAPLDPSCRR